MYTPPEKIRVVLDTNILISAVISKLGYPWKIIELLIQEEIENVSTNEILDEIREVLSRPEIVRRTDEDARQFILEAYENISHFVHPTIQIPPLKQDPSDTKFIEAALAGNAAAIVSGDPHLSRMKNYQTIRIHTPRGFMEWFQAQVKNNEKKDGRARIQERAFEPFKKRFIKNGGKPPEPFKKRFIKIFAGLPCETDGFAWPAKRGFALFLKGREKGASNEGCNSTPLSKVN